MKCIAPKIGKLSLLYHFDQLSNEERKRFEAHLLECDHCFQETYVLGSVTEKMQKDPEPFLAALAKKKPTRVPAIKQRREFHIGLVEAIGRIPALVRIAIPVAAAMVLLFLLIRPTAELSDLALIEPVPYRSLQIKSGAEATDAERLFEEGMAAYVQKDYASSIEKLVLAIRHDSTNAGFHFYLGLCYLLSDSVDLAIEHLQKTITLDGNPVLEKAYWYLGNAWLLKEDRAQALAAFRKVVEMEGDYEWEAQEIIGKIEKLPQK